MFSCLGLAPALFLIGTPVLIAVAALVLLWLGTPRALLVTAAGTIGLTVSTGLYLASRHGSPPPPVWLAALAGAVCFTVAAVACAPGTGWLVRVAVAALVVVALAVIPAWDDASTASHRRQQFAAVTVPLLVPRLPGYRLRSAWVHPAARGFSTTLVPVDADPYRTSRMISADVLPMPADFAPPARCGPRAWEVPDAGKHSPCEVLAQDHWLRSDDGITEHIVRGGGALVIISADPGHVADDELAQAATSLRLADVAELVAAR